MCKDSKNNNNNNNSNNVLNSSNDNYFHNNNITNNENEHNNMMQYDLQDNIYVVMYTLINCILLLLLVGFELIHSITAIGLDPTGVGVVILDEDYSNDHNSDN